MKKIFTVLLAVLVLLMSVMLTGCGGPEATDENPVGSAEEVYEAFLSGVMNAHVAESTDMFAGDATYSISEFAKLCGQYLAKDEYPSTLSETQYAYIDCGADGNPELALSFTYTKEDGMADYTQYLFFKNIAGDLEYIGSTYTYYRAEATINEYGLVTFGGSESAAAYVIDTSFFDADGNERFLYSCETVMAMAEPGIPRSSIPNGLDNPELPDYEFCMDSDTYTTEVYNFYQLIAEDKLAEKIHADGTDVNVVDADEPYNSLSGKMVVDAAGNEIKTFSDDLGNYYTANFNTLLTNNFYNVTDSNGKDATISAEDAAIYDNYGLKIYSSKELESILKDREESMGLTKKIMNGDLPSWQTLKLTEADL